MRLRYINWGSKECQHLAVLLEESAFELGPVVRDDAVWDAKSAHNGLEECDCGFFGDVHHRSNLRPFCEFVNDDVEEPVSANGPGERSRDIHDPYGE